MCQTSLFINNKHQKQHQHIFFVSFSILLQHKKIEIQQLIYMSGLFQLFKTKQNKLLCVFSSFLKKTFQLKNKCKKKEGQIYTHQHILYNKKKRIEKKSRPPKTPPTRSQEILEPRRGAPSSRGTCTSFSNTWC